MQVNGVQAGPTVAGRGHPEALRGKTARQEIRDIRFVLDDDDVAHQSFQPAEWLSGG
jgi:hypothetical protein